MGFWTIADNKKMSSEDFFLYFILFLCVPVVAYGFYIASMTDIIYLVVATLPLWFPLTIMGYLVRRSLDPSSMLYKQYTVPD